VHGIDVAGFNGIAPGNGIGGGAEAETLLAFERAMKTANLPAF